MGQKGMEMALEQITETRPDPIIGKYLQVKIEPAIPQAESAEGLY